MRGRRGGGRRDGEGEGGKTNRETRQTEVNFQESLCFFASKHSNCADLYYKHCYTNVQNNKEETI